MNNVTYSFPEQCSSTPAFGCVCHTACSLHWDKMAISFAGLTLCPLWFYVIFWCCIVGGWGTGLQEVRVGEHREQPLSFPASSALSRLQTAGREMSLRHHCSVSSLGHCHGAREPACKTSMTTQMGTLPISSAGHFSQVIILPLLRWCFLHQCEKWLQGMKKRGTRQGCPERLWIPLPQKDLRLPSAKLFICGKYKGVFSGPRGEYTPHLEGRGTAAMTAAGHFSSVHALNFLSERSGNVCPVLGKPLN